MIPKVNDFLCAGKKLFTVELYIFFYPEKRNWSGIWPSWLDAKKSLFLTRFLKSELHKNFICFQLKTLTENVLVFFCDRFFVFFNFWYIKLPFSTDFEKANWYFVSSFLIKFLFIAICLDLFSNVSNIQDV